MEEKEDSAALVQEDSGAMACWMVGAAAVEIVATMVAPDAGAMAD